MPLLKIYKNQSYDSITITKERWKINEWINIDLDLTQIWHTLMKWSYKGPKPNNAQITNELKDLKKTF